jgi:hypothetical protein
MAKKPTITSIISKKPRLMESYDDFDDDDFMSDLMSEAVQHASAAIQSEQNTALELTKLALAHASNVNEDKVFALFRRAAKEVNDIYSNELIDDYY